MVARRQDFDEGTKIAQQTYGAARTRERPAAPRTINVDTIKVLVYGQSFSFRGVTYSVPALPWGDGLMLEVLQNEMFRLASGAMSVDKLLEMRDTLSEAFDIMWRNIRHRWWQRNPFRRYATMEETMALLGFFYECQTQQPGLSLDVFRATRRRSRWSTILRIPWRNSPARSRRGATRRASHGAMFTSSSASAGWR